MKSIITCLSLLILASSCFVYKSVDKENIEARVKTGDKVKIELANGIGIEKIKVNQVWADSLLLGADTHATKFSEIKSLKKRRISVGGTILGAFGLYLLIDVTIAAANAPTSYNNQGWFGGNK